MAPRRFAAGVALRDIHLHFVWQAWHLTTSIVTLRGRRGALVITPLVITQLVITQLVITQLVITPLAHTPLAHTPFVITQPHTQLHPPSLCVAGVALRDIHLHFVWQAWHLVTSTRHFAWQAWHLTTSTVTLCGRRGTYGTGLALVARVVTRWRGGAAALCMAGVALRDIHLHFVWEARHLVTSTFTLHGRRGTWSHPLSL